VNFFSKARYSDSSCITRLSNPNNAGSIPVAPPTTKKPVKSEQLARTVQLQSSDFYLKAALNNQFHKVEALPPTKSNWREYERLRDLVLRSRRNAGFSPWPPLAFALSVLVALAIWAHRQSSRDFTFSAPADKFQILRRFDAYHYQFRWIRAGAEPVVMNTVFCSNYEPQLSEGETLTWLHYQDLGRCWDILPEGYGYRFERDAQGNPTLSPGCVFNDRDLTDCTVNPSEARF